MLKIYADNGYKRYLNRAVRKQYMRKLKIQCFSKGIIVNEHVHGFGVFTSDFKFIKASEQVRKNNGQFVPKFDKNNIPYVDEDVVWIGNLHAHFGHFMLEQMNRVWAVLDDKYKNMKVVLINNNDVKDVPGYIYELLEMAGVKRDNVIILNQTMRFRCVYVPDQAFNIPVYSANMFGKLYDKMSDSVGAAKKYSKVYVSRSVLQERGTFGEVAVQNIFEKNGYIIIHPETMPLSEQVKMVKNCDVLAGIAGTALHLALFMKPGGTVVQIKRNRLKKCNASVQYLINRTKGLNSVFINASIEKRKTSHYSSIPQIIGVNRYMKQFFDDNNFQYNQADIAFDKDAWDAYIGAMKNWEQLYGSSGAERIKHLIVRITAMFIPGRENRGAYRRWLKRKLKIV